MRGWTRHEARSRDRPGVSPACAGMDLSSTLTIMNPTCFPRMCGDGPASAIWMLRARKFPPHVRGWTLTWRRRA